MIRATEKRSERDSTGKAAVARCFERIIQQIDLGPRYVGSTGHERAIALYGKWFAGADRRQDHVFSETFLGHRAMCRNLWATYWGDQPGRLLLGSHYDTRPVADQDPDPHRRRDPVPGASDASGVALLAEIAADLAQVPRRGRPTVDIVLFDAENWRGIDGREVEGRL